MAWRGCGGVGRCCTVDILHRTMSCDGMRCQEWSKAMPKRSKRMRSIAINNPHAARRGGRGIKNHFSGEVDSFRVHFNDGVGAEC
jgi:hypothetical protein